MIDVHYLCITVHYKWFLLYVRHSSFICLHLSSTFFFIFNFLYPCDHLITQYSGVFCFPFLLYDIMFDMNTLINGFQCKTSHKKLFGTNSFWDCFIYVVLNFWMHIFTFVYFYLDPPNQTSNVFQRLSCLSVSCKNKKRDEEHRGKERESGR